MPCNGGTSDVRLGPYHILPPVPKSRQFKKSQIPKINRRGGLLLLLGMKCRFLGLQICDQGLNPFNRDLIANRQEHSPVMLDLFVEFGAGVAHGEPVQPRTKATLIGCLLVKTAGREICSIPVSKEANHVPLRNQTGDSIR